MAQCNKCGEIDKIVTTEKGYWGKAFTYTVILVIVLAALWSRFNDKTSIWMAIVIFGLSGIYILFIWIKAFSGNKYYSNSCKRCGNTWTEKEE